MKTDKLKKLLVMLILCLAGGTIYILPFLREVYYIPMRDAFGYSNTQMGIVHGVYGAFSLITYFPGGWLADRFEARKLISLALMGSALGGFYLSTLPNYFGVLAIQAHLGICTSLVFWSAMIKATRCWADPENQGRAFGILESGRGVTELALSAALLAIFGLLGGSSEDFASVILLLSAVNLILAVLAWLFLESEEPTAKKRPSLVPKFSQLLDVIKLPHMWLIATVVFCSYCAYWGTFAFAPYATEVFAFSVLAGGTLGVAKMWVKPLAAIAAGFLADQIRTSRMVSITLLVSSASFFLLCLLSGDSSQLGLMILLVMIISITVSSLRAIYFALLEEIDIPLAATGTAVGFASVIGFAPDVFMPLLMGYFLDNYQDGVGYRYFFATIAIICIVGALSSWLIMKRIPKLHRKVRSLPNVS